MKTLLPLIRHASRILITGPIVVIGAWTALQNVAYLAPVSGELGYNLMQQEARHWQSAPPGQYLGQRCLPQTTDTDATPASPVCNEQAVTLKEAAKMRGEAAVLSYIQAVVLTISFFMLSSTYRLFSQRFLAFWHRKHLP